MQVAKVSIGKLFDATQRLEAPLFQRPYVWKKKKNWTPLWETVRRSSERQLALQPRAAFFGTIVLVQRPTPTSRIAAREIIDGQQRLTTLQLVIAAIRDVAGARGVDDYSKAFAKLAENDTPLSTDADERFKVWPTNDDRAAFRAVMREGAGRVADELSDEDPDDGEEENDEEEDSLIQTAYVFFRRKVAEWLSVASPAEFRARLESLHKAVNEDLQLVVIDLESADNPQEIFETLNALGTPLLPADLVKNHLFHLAATQKMDCEELYRLYWSEFSSDRRYWRKEVRQGRLRRPRLDLFLGHYLALRMARSDLTVNELFEGFREYLGPV